MAPGAIAPADSTMPGLLVRLLGAVRMRVEKKEGQKKGGPFFHDDEKKEGQTLAS